MRKDRCWAEREEVSAAANYFNRGIVVYSIFETSRFGPRGGPAWPMYWNGTTHFEPLLPLGVARPVAVNLQGMSPQVMTPV